MYNAVELQSSFGPELQSDFILSELQRGAYIKYFLNGYAVLCDKDGNVIRNIPMEVFIHYLKHRFIRCVRNGGARFHGINGDGFGPSYRVYIYDDRNRGRSITD